VRHALKREERLQGEASRRRALPDLRLRHGQALRREEVPDLAGPYPEGQRADRPVGRRVAVAAGDRHPGLRQTELGADHVDDALVAGGGYGRCCANLEARSKLIGVLQRTVNEGQLVLRAVVPDAIPPDLLD
jgi:hypothetical protein